MATYFATAAYKPPVRQEGFHLPHQNPPSPSSSSTGGYDPTSMFMLPEAFRKYPSQDNSAIDLTEELASLIAGPNADHAHSGMHMHQQGQHSQQQTPQQQHHDFRGAPASYDDGYRPQTHNIFDISAPSVTHPSLLPHPSQSQLPTPSSSAPTYPSAFSLQTNQRPTHDMGLISPPSSLHSTAGPLQEFSTRFNSTLPALNSSMRFDPHPPAAPESSTAGASAFALQHDFNMVRQQHTPSPSQGQSAVSRSRSRSRAPSTGPGPTRTQSTTRAKRNSISSTSPPPRPATSIIIPGSMPPLHRANSLSAAAVRGAPEAAVGSPLSLGSAGGWFIPPTTPQQQHAEYSLPTPDSISSHFGLPGREHSLGPSLDGGRDPSPPGTAGSINEVAAKQAAIANEKRRRRRESHNAVERRRRDNINEKIGELATLIPECMLDPNAPLNIVPTEDQIMGVGSCPKQEEDGADPSPTPTGADPSPHSNVSGESAAAKANKGIILRKSVDYIRHLQQIVTEQANRNRALESELANYRAREGGGALGSTTTSGDDLNGLVLHNEVDMSAFMGGDFPFGAGSSSFGSLLESVSETDMDVIEDERPGTATTNMSALLTPPSITDSGSPPSTIGDEDEPVHISGGYHHHEEERGRRGRDGRVGGALDEVRVKREE